MEIYNRTLSNNQYSSVDQLTQYSHLEKTSCSTFFQKTFCCSKSEPVDEILEEIDLLEEVKKMQKVGGIDNWKNKDSLNEYTSIYYSLPKEVRSQLKEIAIESYIERHKSLVWAITDEDAYKILRKMAKEQILNITCGSCDEILSKYIDDPTSRHPKLKEEVTLKQRVIGLVLAPFRKIAELVSMIFQKIFFCCSKRMSEKKVLKIVQVMLETINHPDIYSIRNIDILFKSLPSDVQTKLKEDLIDQYSKYLGDEKMNLTKEDQEAWKKQNYKTLEHFTYGLIFDNESNKDHFAPILKQYINELKA